MSAAKTDARYGASIPKSRRCPSRNPEKGWMTCQRERGHDGACEEGGYLWHRGRGHMKPRLISRPKWIEEASEDAERVAAVGSVPVFGRDRLPMGKRWNVNAERASASYVANFAAWLRFLARARKQSTCTRAECPCRKDGDR